MGDENHGQPELLLQLAKQCQNLSLDFGIQHAHAFITDQHLGFQGQGSGDGHPLLLAPGKLAGKAVLITICGYKPHAFHQLTALFSSCRW